VQALGAEEGEEEGVAAAEEFYDAEEAPPAVAAAAAGAAAGPGEQKPAGGAVHSTLLSWHAILTWCVRAALLEHVRVEQAFRAQRCFLCMSTLEAPCLRAVYAFTLRPSFPAPPLTTQAHG
jgi:hypothetical protein